MLTEVCLFKLQVYLNIIKYPVCFVASCPLGKFSPSFSQRFLNPICKLQPIDAVVELGWD